MKVRLFLRLASLLMLTMSLWQPLSAQEAEGKAQPQDEEQKSSANTNKAKFAAIPVLNYNESTGLGLGAMVGVFYPVDRKDDVSPPSSTMVFGFYAKNKTNAFGLGQKLYLKEDTYRLTMALVRASINFQFYNENIAGDFIDYNTGARFFLVQAERRVIKNFYLGLKYRYNRSRTTFDIPIEYDPPEVTYSGLGPVISFDSRDSVFGPRRGQLIKLDAVINHDVFGSARDYTILEAAANAYFPLPKNAVLAARIFAKAGVGDMPFEDQAIMVGTDLRGYSSGKFRGEQKYTFQAEYRRSFSKKIGAVAFGGFGWVADDIAQIRLTDILPSIGVGVRYLMIPAYGINVGFDFAVGKDDTAFYFRIGEAF
jgi:hemolysin activation/secretion protein